MVFCLALQRQWSSIPCDEDLKWAIELMNEQWMSHMIPNIRMLPSAPGKITMMDDKYLNLNVHTSGRKYIASRRKLRKLKNRKLWLISFTRWSDQPQCRKLPCHAQSVESSHFLQLFAQLSPMLGQSLEKKMQNSNCFHFIKCPFTSICQIVQVVSMLDVPISDTSTSFQSADVSGAQYSEERFWIGKTMDLSWKIKKRKRKWQLKL